jgi:hypothetical protein
MYTPKKESPADLDTVAWDTLFSAKLPERLRKELGNLKTGQDGIMFRVGEGSVLSNWNSALKKEGFPYRLRTPTRGIGFPNQKYYLYKLIP